MCCLCPDGFRLSSIYLPIQTTWSQQFVQTDWTVSMPVCQPWYRIRSCIICALCSFLCSKVALIQCKYHTIQYIFQWCLLPWWSLSCPCSVWRGGILASYSFWHWNWTCVHSVDWASTVLENLTKFCNNSSCLQAWRVTETMAEPPLHVLQVYWLQLAFTATDEEEEEDIYLAQKQQ